MDKSTEFARVIAWSPRWDVGAPLPQVFSSGHRTFLIYMISESDPNWDGSYLNIISNKSEETYPLALVEFIRPDTHRFGTVNDEAGEGHPLARKGLEYYAAHVVENSSWIAELKSIHRVHPYFKESSWVDKKHFLLFFHDEMFEIVAVDYKIETFRSTFLDVSTEVRINS